MSGYEKISLVDFSATSPDTITITDTLSSTLTAGNETGHMVIDVDSTAFYPGDTYPDTVNLTGGNWSFVATPAVDPAQTSSNTYVAYLNSVTGATFYVDVNAILNVS